MPDEGAEAVRHELVRLSHEWMEAVQRHDVARLEQLLARDFKLVGRVGEMSREEWLANAAGPYEIDEFSYDEIDVQLFGDTAVLHSRYRQKARLGDDDLSLPLVVTDVWVRRDGRWQVAHRHATVDPRG